jgi:hypothetical protein
MRAVSQPVLWQDGPMHALHRLALADWLALLAFFSLLDRLRLVFRA